MSKTNYAAMIAMAVSAALFHADVSCAQQNMDGYIVAPTPVHNSGAVAGSPVDGYQAPADQVNGGGYVDGGGYTDVNGNYVNGNYVDNGYNLGAGCADGGFGCADGGCSTGGCGGNLFGWSNGGGCGAGQRCRIMSEGFHQGWAHMKHVNQKVMARNQAWPKPFDCADRQLYFAMFEPMIDTGMADMCTLSAAHFDQHSNELNRLGESAVASIMQNMPASRKNIYIQQDSNESISDVRMTSVRNTVERWYGHVPAPGIAFTNRYPMTHSGSRVELINGAYAQELPPPVIAVGDSTQSTSDTGQ
ncbi:MAG: hypothetical protein AAF456_22870 [Planctomycetota bacterium]